MKTTQKQVYVIGYASAIAGPDPSAGEGPLVMRNSAYLQALQNKQIDLQWQAMIIPEEMSCNNLTLIANDNRQLADYTFDLVTEKKFFAVLGGDHTCAVGTWSGVASAIQDKGELGLIWIDAHMDSHTPQTTLTGNYHGMPLACLLGFGAQSLTDIRMTQPKIKPENLCLIGIRSFEAEEKELLTRLNIRIYYMDEVIERGIDVVMKEALGIVTQGTAGYGVSLDIDSIDPLDAPATDVSEPGGIKAVELCHALRCVAGDPRLLGIEITEFDPHRDIDNKTEKLIPELMLAMLIPS